MGLLLIIKTYQLSQRHLVFNCTLQEPNGKLSKVALSVAPLNMEKISLPPILINVQAGAVASACANAMVISSSKIGSSTIRLRE
jgi:hypothetical protein